MKKVMLIDVAKAGETPCCHKDLQIVDRMKVLAQLTDTRAICICECGQMFDLDSEEQSVTFITKEDELA